VQIDFLDVLVNFSAIIISLTIHEYAHAWTANYLGDPTPAQHNRLNLNPLTIIKEHPFGAFLVPLFAATQGFLIGWAATPVNPRLVDRKYKIRFAERWIALAGPLSNVILAILSSFVLALCIRFKSVDPLTFTPLIHLSHAMVMTNIFLALFNMMPVQPFDGFIILKNSMKRDSPIIALLEEYSTIAMLFVFVFGFRVLSSWIYVIYKVLTQFCYAIIG
jgi:Zn-dependent protease